MTLLVNVRQVKQIQARHVLLYRRAHRASTEILTETATTAALGVLPVMP